MTKKIDYNKWHSGPPPSVGWWPASWSKRIRYYRWWDGERWSMPAVKNCSAKTAARIALTPSSMEKFARGIFWKHRPASWPARSRT